MAQGTGLPIPKNEPVLADTQRVMSSDAGASAWGRVAAASEKLADAGVGFAKIGLREIEQAKAGQMAAAELEDQKKQIELRDANQYNPAAFEAAWDGYTKGVLEKAPLWSVKDRSVSLGKLGIGAYRAVVTETRARDNQLESQAVTARLKQAGEDIISGAMAGTLQPSDERLQNYNDILTSAVNLKLMPQEVADIKRDDVMSTAFGESAARDGVREYREKGLSGAEQFLRSSILENDKLTLSASQKTRIYNRGMQAVRTEQRAEMQGRGEIVNEARDLTARISSGQPVDDATVQETGNALLRVGAMGPYRKMMVEYQVQQDTRGLDIRGLGQAAARSRAAATVGTPEQAGAISGAAQRLGVAPRDLAAAISYETGGTFDPNKQGGKGNNYLGLIQFGPEERMKYGVRPGMSFEQQMTAVEGFLRDRGVKPGMGIAEIYRTIIGGNPNAPLTASDGNGTIAQHIERIKSGHYGNADRFLGGKPEGMSPYAGEIAKRTQEVLVSQARKEWPGIQQRISAGKMIDGEDVNALRMAAFMSGDAAWIKQVEDTLAASSIGSQLAPLPVGQHQAAMDQARAVFNDDVNKVLQQQFDRKFKMVQENPIDFHIEGGGKAPSALNVSDSAAFHAGLRERAMIVQATADQSGVLPGPVLRKAELASARAAIEGASPDNKIRIFSDMAAALPEPIYRATMNAMGQDTLTMFVGGVARERPEIAREILRGADLMTLDKTGEKGSLVRDAFRDKIGRDLYPSASDQNNVTQAAMALYTARRGASGSLYDPTDTAGIEKAIEDVAGKIITRNGMKVAVPPGMREGIFARALDRLTAEQLSSFGGAFDGTGRPFDPAFLGERAVLKQLGPGVPNYVVGMRDTTARDGFAPVLTTEGYPLVIDMKAIAASSPKPELTPYQRGLTQFRTGQAERIQDARRQSTEAP